MITLVSFEQVELWLVAPWLALFYALVVSTLVRHWRADTLWQSALVGLLPLLLVIVFFVNPVSTRRIALADRFLPFIVPLTIIWIATLTPGRWMARLVAAVAIVTTLATAGFRLWIYDRHDASIQRYLAAASAMTPGRSLLPLHLQLEEGSRDFAVMPLIHASAHLARERDLAYLRGSLLSRSVYGYFPVVYRAESDPYRHLNRWLDDVPPEVDLGTYETATGNRLDYLLVWPPPAAVPSTPEIAALLAQVEAGWRPLPLPPEASVGLFEHRDGGGAVPSARMADETAESGARR
jgi:hypothetical protein